MQFRFLILVPGHGDRERWPYLKKSIETLQNSFSRSQYFSARDVDCAIFTWRKREEYDLERIVHTHTQELHDSGLATTSRATHSPPAPPHNGTGVHRCAVVRNEQAHYQNALWNAYEQFIKGVGTGTTNRKSENYENKTYYDYVLVLLDDVHVARFDPDFVFPVIWENELAVLQPHSLCAASSRLPRDYWLDSLAHYAIPGWNSRTFEMQFTVFANAAFACFAEETLKNIGHVKGGFDKLFFWACGGEMSRIARTEWRPRKLELLEHAKGVRRRPYYTTTVTTRPASSAITSNHVEAVPEFPPNDGHVGPPAGTTVHLSDHVHAPYSGSRDVKTLLSAPPPSSASLTPKQASDMDSADHFWQHKWGEVPYDHWREAVEGRVIDPGNSVMEQTVQVTQLRKSQYDHKIVFPVGHMWFRAISLHLVWAVSQGMLYMARDNDHLLTKGEKRKSTQLRKNVRLLGELESGSTSEIIGTAEDRHLDRPAEDQANEQVPFSSPERKGNHAEEDLLPQEFWNFSLVKMQRKYMAEMFVNWRKEVVALCAATGVRYFSSRNATTVERYHEWLLSEKSCLPDKYQFQLHQMQRSGKPRLLVALDALFAPVSEAEVAWLRRESRSDLLDVAGAGTSTTVPEEIDVAVEVEQVLKFETFSQLLRRFATTDGAAVLTKSAAAPGAAASSVENHKPEPDESQSSAIVDKKIKIIRSLPDLIFRLDKKALSEFLHHVIVETGGTQPWPVDSLFTKRASLIFESFLHSDAQKFLTGALSFALALTTDFSVETELLPRPLRELTKTRFLPRRTYLDELSLHMSRSQKQNLMHSFMFDQERDEVAAGAAGESFVAPPVVVSEDDASSRGPPGPHRGAPSSSRTTTTPVVLSHRSTKTSSSSTTSKKVAFSQPQQLGSEFIGRLPLASSFGSVAVEESDAGGSPSRDPALPLPSAEDDHDVDVEQQNSSELVRKQQVYEQMLNETYYFDRALKFDPFAVAQYNLDKEKNKMQLNKQKPNQNRRNVFTKKMAVGESSRLVRGGRDVQGNSFTQLLDLEQDLTFLTADEFHDALNDHSLVNLLHCSEANQIAANDPNRHIGINEQGWDRENSKVVT
ncbi:unnamed protein product [Amoebophrya sp. A120]|nr:unnamed protein product [Amoebophrya sp. A120]|eukprot:GSA120T00000272001.1